MVTIMTMPDERYRAVINTRKFLKDILWGEYEEIPQGSEIWERARRCLKHYPGDYHMGDVAETSEHFEKNSNDGLHYSEEATESLGIRRFSIDDATPQEWDNLKNLK